MMRTTVAVLMVAFVCIRATAAEAPPRDQLGHEVKLRILVDKVMQPTAKWHTEEWMIKEAAEAGFNVFSPRVGHERLDEVAQVTSWCAKYGIYHMPWMRGSLTAPDGPEADGKRMLWPGGEQPLWSPNSDEFWEWTTRYIVEYAKMSAENPTLMGVFLDYENYAKGPRGGNLYGLSYDDVIMGKFAEHKGIELPELGPKERKPWLEEQGLHEEFEAFQIAHWRERCRTLREAVDQYDPTFVFCIYPAPGTPFMIKACYPEWATDQAPLILADPWTYGRSSRFMPQATALETNKRILQRGLDVARQAGINFIYSGGIDPAVTGADPEFCAKNAVMISEMTGGYWVFYEGPKYDTTHPEYFRWFKWANDAIAAGEFDKYKEPRENPDGLAAVIHSAGDTTARLSPPPMTGEVIEYPPTFIRGDHLLLVAAKPGRQVEIVLRNYKLGAYTDPLVWDLRDIEMNQLDSGQIGLQEEGTVKFTAGDNGIYVLGVAAGRNMFALVSSNTPVAILADQRVHTVSHTGRLYFAVPEGIKRFTLKVRGGGGETARLNIYDPDDELAATCQTTPDTNQAEAQVTVGDAAGRIWSLEITRADEGALEDAKIYLDPALPPAFSLDPAHVFGAAAQ
ncbi:MAG: hypothetical protein J7M38_04155 [Armatimonadetes bacterium]|nr:hypothetical protein [Armatimonadota bacterium]